MKLIEDVQVGELLAKIQPNGGRKERLAKVGEDVLVLKPCVRCVQSQNCTLQLKSHTISKRESSTCRDLSGQRKVPRKRARITQDSGPDSCL